jgi:hypothetical protein
MKTWSARAGGKPLVSEEGRAARAGRRAGPNLCLLALVSAVVCAPGAAAPAEDAATRGDAVLQAMQAELERARGLALPNLDKPYFIEFAADEAHVFSTSAALGASFGATERRFRIPRVRMRVGSADFDNGNYVFTEAGGASRYDPEQLVIDDAPGVLRRAFWLAADRSYKNAVQAITRKRAALKQVVQTEKLPDLWPAEPTVLVKGLQSVTERDWGDWPERVRRISETLKNYPEVLMSNVSMEASVHTFRLHNSEGTTVRNSSRAANFTARASGRTPQGGELRDAVVMPMPGLDTVPGEEELLNAVRTMAENIKALTAAPAGENYIGPVLVEGLAAAQLVADVLAPQLTLHRRPVAEPGRNVPSIRDEFEGRLESFVLPPFLSAVDDPTKTEFEGKPLLGSYEIDEEGVRAAPLTLIADGRLKSILLTRQPIAGQKASNGRARVPGPFGANAAAISNLFVNASESLPSRALRERLIEKIKAANKPYGVIVRKLDFPSTASAQSLRQLVAASRQDGVARPAAPPVLVYRLYPDGREELIRDLRWRGLSVRAMRAIEAVSQERFVLNYLNNLAPFALIGAAPYVAPSSVIAPSMLFEELELEKMDSESLRPPLVSAPPAVASAATP